MNNIPLPKTVKLAKGDANTGILTIEPCFPGFGLTIANALRRVLLSSLDGAAVTNTRIKGADHEFSTLPHIKEDVVNIVLNLKQLRFKAHTGKPVTLSLKAKGETIVKAKDLKGSSDMEIVNKDQVIATLTDKKAELDMEITVLKGIGYLPVEAREDEEKIIGDIKIDASFSPVDKVSYEIDNVRVGQATNYDRIIMEITTDGTVSPKEALEKSADILVDQFATLAGVTEAETEKKKKIAKTPSHKKTKKVVAKKPATKATKTEDAKLEELKLSSRTINALLKAKYKKLSQLARITEKEFIEIPGVGDNAMKEVSRYLKRRGFNGFKEVK